MDEKIATMLFKQVEMMVEAIFLSALQSTQISNSPQSEREDVHTYPIVRQRVLWSHSVCTCILRFTIPYGPDSLVPFA
jgi:hypothetical protein